MPATLLEEVFALNEELDEIRELRESGAEPQTLLSRLETARVPIEQRREAHEQQVRELSAQWDAQQDNATAADKRPLLEALREQLLERNYINNLLATIEREVAGVDDGLQSAVSGGNAAAGLKTEHRRP